MKNDVRLDGSYVAGLFSEEHPNYVSLAAHYLFSLYFITIALSL